MRPRFVDAKVAFVILTWNSAAFIEACLDAVLGLSCASLDVWVEDNGSTDGTREVLQSMTAADARLHVFFNDRNLGTTVSRNRALRAISKSTDYVCVLDSDTVVNQEAFDAMACALEDEDIGVVGPVMADSASQVQLSGRNLPTLQLKLGKACPIHVVSEWAASAEVPCAPIRQGLQDVGYLLSACWLMPYASLQAVGLLDEAIFYAPEDVDWCLRCHEAGLRVVVCHDARIIHEYQRVTRKQPLSRVGIEHVKGLAHYFWKHRYLIRSPWPIAKGAA